MNRVREDAITMTFPSDLKGREASPSDNTSRVLSLTKKQKRVMHNQTRLPLSTPIDNGNHARQTSGDVALPSLNNTGAPLRSRTFVRRVRKRSVHISRSQKLHVCDRPVDLKGHRTSASNNTSSVSSFVKKSGKHTTHPHWVR